jgi:hypothetical protein
MTLSIYGECLSVYSENYLFSKLQKEYQDDFENMISRRQYSDRRKLLFEKPERIRKLMSVMLNKEADVFAIDLLR